MNIDIASLDPKEIGNWPVVAKAVVIAIVCIAILAAGFWFDTKEQRAELQKHKNTEAQLFADFEKKQAKAANLEAYKQQLAEMKESFGTMLKQLPSKTEVAELLVDVSQTGLATGLEFELFKPEAEIPREFYAELPIKLRVVGDYHEFGNFVSGVAALPRIVTLHDFQVSPPKGRATTAGKLVMEATARTYRYLDEEELAARDAEAKKSKKKSKKR